jgi:hypothetical protein
VFFAAWLFLHLYGCTILGRFAGAIGNCFLSLMNASGPSPKTVPEKGRTASTVAPGEPALDVRGRDALWRQYVAGVSAGDPEALAKLYDESSSLVYALALRILGDAADAEEVTLDVYTQVWRTAASFDAGRGTTPLGS